MRIKKSDLYFYEMLRDFLYKYLVIQRGFSPATVKNYTDSLDQYRQYLKDQKGIPFDKVGFHCFSKEMIYDFCIWLRDNQKKAISTVNLRLSAIKSFLCYCSEEDLYLLGLVYILLYLKHISSYSSDFPSISFGRVLFPSLRTVLCILPSHSVFRLLHITSAGHFQFHRLKHLL